MSQSNPWADTTSQGQPYTSENHPNPLQQHGQTQPPQQHEGQNQPYYSDPQEVRQPQQSGTTTYAPPSGPPPSQGAPPSQGINRTTTEQLLAQEPDRGAQFEQFQQYESQAHQTEDDRNQAELQKQFPNIDSSLIAALYNERIGNMGEVRELLQELNTS